jgi:hypothetical protein
MHSSDVSALVRNTEYFRIEGNRIKEIDVYFGTSAAAEESATGPPRRGMPRA